MTRTLRRALVDTTRQLSAAGIPTPRLEARLLLELVTGLSREAQLSRPERPLSEAEAARLATLIARRLAREPVAYLAGRREFRGRVFEVGPEVLVPRPESELLVDLALERFGGRSREAPRLLDLGTGSGCLLVSLLAELPLAFGVGTDLSFPALRIARRNAATHAVRDRAGFVCTRWAEALRGPFDLVVANPPYLTADELAAAEPELRHEPALALAAGVDGLDAYRAIAADLPRILAADGLAAVELAAERAVSIAALFEAAGLRVVEIRPDLAGRPRVLLLAPRRSGLRSGPGAPPVPPPTTTGTGRRSRACRL